MKQEDKDLLLRDLCARLPYKIRCSYYDICLSEHCNGEIYGIENKEYIIVDGKCIAIEFIKPYLFPLSSMTKEQKEELKSLGWNFDNFEIHNVSECLGTYREYVAHSDCFELIDWFNKNHFDYRGLIPIGLAIDATELNIY